jgi:hypothetical protein
VRLIALDGSTFNMRAMMEGVRLAMPTPGSLLFAGTARDEVLPSRPQALAAAAAAGGPLDLRLRHAMVSSTAHLNWHQAGIFHYLNVSVVDNRVASDMLCTMHTSMERLVGCSRRQVKQPATRSI